MFGAVTGGRKFKAFIYIFTANCVAMAASMVALGFGKDLGFTADHFERISYFCGGFYAGANVIKAAVEVLASKMGKKNECQ